MKMIYDILVNFSDSDNLIEFYEWEEEDNVENLKEVPIYKVNTTFLDNLINYKLKINKEFLKKINDKTINFTNETFKYICLFTDLNKVIGVEFLKTGEVAARTTLLIDEEEDTIEESNELEEENIIYEVLEKYKISFNTKKELKNKNFLLHELDKIYNEKEIEELNYIYKELINKRTTSTISKYNQLKEKIESNYTIEEDKIANLLKQSYIKKQTIN